MFDKESLEYLVGLGEVALVEADGRKFSTKKLFEVDESLPTPLSTSTLTGLVDYIVSGIDKVDGRMLIHIASPTTVLLCSELRGDAQREYYLRCEALLPRITFESFVDVEKFNIMLQSSFVDNKDRDLLLKVTGNIKEENVKQVGSDGVSQAVTVKTGVATVNDVIIPNPVILAPFRTFPEIEQVESKFIYRMQDGPKAALFEGDGGAWRNEAMNRIKKYLSEQLADYKNVQIIS